MATLRIDSNESFETKVIVRESDEYSEQVYLRLERHYIPEEIRGVNEMFLSPTQLEFLGRFLVRQADEIRTAQAQRKLAK